MVYSMPGSSVHGDSPGKNTGVDCHALLQGIFPTQGLNTGLSHCRQFLSRLSHQGSPEHVKPCPDGSSELTRDLVLRVGPTGDTAKEVVRCCGQVGEERDALGGMMAQTEDGAREAQAILVSGQKTH